MTELAYGIENPTGILMPQTMAWSRWGALWRWSVIFLGGELDSRVIEGALTGRGFAIKRFKLDETEVPAI